MYTPNLSEHSSQDFSPALACSGLISTIAGIATFVFVCKCASTASGIPISMSGKVFAVSVAAIGNVASILPKLGDREFHENGGLSCALFIMAVTTAVTLLFVNIFNARTYGYVCLIPVFVILAGACCLGTCFCLGVGADINNEANRGYARS